MTKSIKPLTNKQIQQQYSKRIKAFLRQVKKWLPDDLEMIESIPDFTVTDNTGTYHVEMATIYRKNVPRADGFVADILPFGTIISCGESILEISGAFSQETLTHFHRNNQSLDSDGWYWLDKSASRDVTLVTSEQFFDLIELVNCESPDDEDFMGFE